MTKKIWTLAILLILSFFITTNLPERSQSSERASPVTETITLGYSNWSGWWLWEIAKEEKLFAKNNVDVEMIWYDNYTDSLTDLAAGRLDGNCQTLNDTIPRAENAVNGEVVVLVNDNSAGNDKIIVTEDINTVEDLRGKKVAVEAGVVDDFLLTLALQEAGMSRDDVEIVDLETGAAAAAFARKKVDAVGAFPPFWLEALEREGSHELISSREFPGAIPDLLVVTQKLVDEKPEQVRALVNTWFDILEFMEQNPERANEIITNLVGITAEELALFQSGVKLFDKKDNLLAFEKGNDMTHLNYAGKKISEFYQNEIPLIEKEPNLDNLLNPYFLPQL